MTAASAIGHGFRRAFGEPRAIAAELAWRWSAGAAFVALLVIAAIEVMRTTIVIGGHPFAGLLPRLALVGASLLGGAALLWVLTEAAGRSATLPLLFRETPVRARFRPLAGIAFLRCTVALAAFLALLLAWRLASGVAVVADRDVPLWWMLAFIPAAALVIFFWAVLQWFLSLSPVFTAAGDCDALGAIAGAVDLCRQRPGAMLLIGGVFWILELWIAGAFALVTFNMAVGMARFPAAVLIVVAMAGFAYCGFAGVLRLARLGACAALVEEAVQPS